MNDDNSLNDPLELYEDDLNKLGLREHPFLDHADEAFLYSDSQLEMTANIVMEYLANPATTVVLTGENGLGKTTYLRKVLRLGYQQYQFCTLRANPDVDFAYIENKIKQRWVLNDNNEQSSVIDLSIENYVITYLREHTHAVLIIDDAHLLEASTLDRLFTLKHRIGLACPLSLGFILAGETTLKSTIAELEDSNPACTQVYQINVRPFSHEQTKNYIEHRLDVAGLEGEVLFDDAKVTEIYKATSGNIKQIHEQAVLALKQQCNEDFSIIDQDPYITIRRPKPKIPVLFLTLTAILGIGLYFNYKFSNKLPEDATIPLDTPKTSEPTLSPIAQDSHKPKDQQTPSLPLPNSANATYSELEISNVKTIGPTEPQSTDIELPSLLAESVETLDQTQLTELKETLVEKVVEVNTNNNLTKPEDPVKPKKVEKQKVSTPAKSGEAWLKNLDPSHFTIQVVATKDRKQLEALVKREKLTSDYAYFGKPVKNDTYYVLVIGDYKNRAKANTAVGKLSTSLRKNKPWPVPVKNVQKFLN